MTLVLWICHHELQAGAQPASGLDPGTCCSLTGQVPAGRRKELRDSLAKWQSCRPGNTQRAGQNVGPGRPEASLPGSPFQEWFPRLKWWSAGLKGGARPEPLSFLSSK